MLSLPTTRITVTLFSTIASRKMWEHSKQVCADLLRATGGVVEGSGDSPNVPGWSLHVTGTCRMGHDPKKFVPTLSARRMMFRTCTPATPASSSTARTRPLQSASWRSLCALASTYSRSFAAETSTAPEHWTPFWYLPIRKSRLSKQPFLVFSVSLSGLWTSNSCIPLVHGYLWNNSARTGTPQRGRL